MICIFPERKLKWHRNWGLQERANALAEHQNCIDALGLSQEEREAQLQCARERTVAARDYRFFNRRTAETGLTILSR